MRLKTFFEKFDYLLGTPGSIAKIRGLILELATRGRLVRQDPSEESAPIFLSRLAREMPEKERIRQAAPQPPVDADSVPYVVPNGWTWARFRDVAIIASNLVKPKDFLDLPHLAPDNIEKGTGVLLACSTVREDKVISSNHRFYAGQLVYSKIRPNLSKVVVATFDGLCSADMYPVDALIRARYLQIYMLSKAFLTQAVKSDTRVAMPKINQAELNAIVVAVPPLAEQDRIVAEVDELMAFCDELDAYEKERETRHATLGQASLARFAEAPTAANLNLLFHDSYAIEPDDLRQSILALAVRGKLVPQDRAEQPAALWLQAQPKLTPPSTVEADDPGFALPGGWTWLRMQDVFEVAGGIQKTPHRAPRKNAFPYLGVANVQRGQLDLANVKQFELQPGELERRRLQAGDLLIIEGNGSLSEIGRCAIWNDEIPNCVHQNHVIRCRPFDVRISSFTLLVLNSPIGIESMQRLAITTAGLYSLSVGKIRQIGIPMPPLREQARIVARVNQLMTLVDQLEAQLASASVATERLTNAILAELTAQA